MKLAGGGFFHSSILEDGNDLLKSKTIKTIDASINERIKKLEATVVLLAQELKELKASITNAEYVKVKRREE